MATDPDTFICDARKGTEDRKAQISRERKHAVFVPAKSGCKVRSRRHCGTQSESRRTSATADLPAGASEGPYQHQPFGCASSRKVK